VNPSVVAHNPEYLPGIDSSNVKWNNEGSFLNDMHKDLKADYIIANPPFNDSDWSGELLRDDARWSVLGKKLPPPPANANYAWIQHFLYHLAPTGQTGFVLAKGSLTTKTNNEGDIRMAMVENDLIDCIVNLPTKLFLNTQIPTCLWFLSRNKQQRKGKILFIDTRIGQYIDIYDKPIKDHGLMQAIARVKLQGAEQCSRRPDPENDFGILLDITHFFGFERILNGFLIVSFWNFPGVRINKQSSIENSICDIKYKYYTKEVQYSNCNCYYYPDRP